MSKRNIILITIVLIIIAVIAFVFLYFYKPNTITEVRTTGTNFLSEFFPFGKNKTTPESGGTPPVDISGFVPTETEGQRELLAKVSTMPIAGYGIFMKERFTEVAETPNPPETASPETTIPDEGALPSTPSPKEEAPLPTAPTTEFAPAVRYVERATGNIYQTFADKIDERKFTITTIPAVYEAYFGDKGESVIIRYLKQDGKTIASFAGTLPKEFLSGDTSQSNELEGSFLPENITDMSLSPDGSSMFYLFDVEDTSVGVTAMPSGDKKNQIFSSSFTEWLTGWPNARMITLTTKPSFLAPGFMYYIDPSVKKMNKIISGINGLTTLTSPSGKLSLYNKNDLSLRVYSIDTESSTPLGIKTMPEKCTWTADSTTLYCAVPKNIAGEKFPDVWYQGEVSFSDEIWRINVESGSATMIADPISFKAGEEIDGIKLSLDENGDYLFFVNKKDSYLWELSLK